MKKHLSKAMTVLALLVAPMLAMAAEDPIYTGIFSNKAVGGYDTVAYHTEGKALEGSKDFMTEWKGAEWHFTSQENLNMFKEDPEKYAPQYGGYCAYALAYKGDLVSTSPKAWHIKDGKLYLNYNDTVSEIWLEKRDEYIEKADGY